MSSTLNDDLFQGTSMTFGEHLEELRNALIYSFYWLAAGTIVGLWLGNSIVDFIKHPLEEALQEHYLKVAEMRIRERMDGLKAAGENVPELDLVLSSVRNERLVPQAVYVDPQEILTEVNRQSPNAVPATLPPPVVITRNDFSDFEGFSKLIAAQDANAEPSVGKRIWELLSVEARSNFNLIAGSLPVTEAQTSEALHDLNRVLTLPDFYNAAAFKNVPLDSQLQSLVARMDSIRPYERARVNRWLLSAAFPTQVELAKPQQTMVRFFQWVNIQDDPRTHLKALSAQEMFMIYFKAAIIFGIILASPGIFYHLWNFVGAGLYPHEKRYVQAFLPMSIGLFLLGAMLAYFFVFYYVLQFLLSFNLSVGVDPDIRISEWLNFALFLPLGFGISFQLPLVMLFLERIGVLQIKNYWDHWRISVLVIFVLSMILTPGGDPYSMIAMSVSLTGLYFFGIFLCHYWPKTRNPFPEMADV